MKNTLRVFVPVLFSILAFGASAPSAFAATTTWTVDSASATTTCVAVTDTTCKTIQAAIDAAGTGDTIVVAAGTYPEKLLIDGKTSLTIQGAGQGKNGGPLTLIEPASNDTGTAGITIKNSNSLTIQDLKIHTAGNEMEGIWVYGFAFGANAITGLTIQNTTITVDGGSSGQSAAGIVADAAANAAHSGWNIIGNTITSNNGVAISIQDVSASTISGNTLTVQTAGTNILWTSERHNLTGLSFTGNILSGSGGVQVLFVTDYNQVNSNVNVEDPIVETTINGVTISGNSFSNWDTRAIKVGDQANLVTGTVTGISIIGNTFNDDHSTSVNFAGMTTTIIGGLDAPSATGSGNIFNVSGAGKIQTAVDEAFAGDTINVAEGTYVEQLTIDKNLTLIGAGEDKTTIQSPNTTLDSTFTATINKTVSSMKPIITIKGADANISALKVDGNGKGDSVNNTFFVGIGFYNAGGSLEHVTVAGVKETPASRDYQGDAVRATDDNGSLHNLSITNSTISDFQKNGITLSGSGLTVTVSDNHVTGSGAIDLVAQNGIVLGAGVTGSVTDNTVKDLMCDDSTCGSDWYGKSQAIALALVGVGSKTASGNTISNSDIGIYNELASGIATITNNILTGNRWFGMLFETGDAAVSGGSVTDGQIGIFNPSEHNSGSTTVHNVNISGNSIAGLKNDAASFNVDATNNWWGTASSTEIAAKISGSGINHDPWFTNVAMTTLSDNTGTNAIYTSTTIGQADMPAGATAVVLTDTTVLDLSNATTSESSSATIDGNTVVLTQSVVLQSGTEGTPVVLTNSNLADVSASIPDGTKISGPAGWDGTIEPPMATSTSGNAPAGFSVGSTVISIGSPDGTLVFDKAVTILLAGVTGTVGYRPAGSDTWIQITNTCGNTYDAPTAPTYPGECAINNGTDTKILTYHFTSFGGLNTVVTPPYHRGSVSAKPATPAVPGVSPAVPATPSINTNGNANGRVLGASAFNFTRNLGVGLSGADVTALQQILIDAGILKINAPTGNFGQLTKAAVQAFQKQHGVSQTGFVGPLTRGELNKGVTPTATNLTSVQADAILSILESFGADASVVAKVRASLGR